MPLLSDGDLAAAFTTARPALRLRLDVRPATDCEQLGGMGGLGVCGKPPRFALMLFPHLQARCWRTGTSSAPVRWRPLNPLRPPRPSAALCWLPPCPSRRRCGRRWAPHPSPPYPPQLHPSSLPAPRCTPPRVYCQHLRSFSAPISNAPASFLTSSVLLY